MVNLMSNSQIPALGAQGSDLPVSKRQVVSTGTFFFYCWFLLDFFLRFPPRIPVYGQLRPTLVLVAVLAGLLFIQRDKLAGATRNPVMQAFIGLVVYLGLSFFLVEWPGSVIRNNLSDFVKAAVFLVFTVLVVDTEGRLKKTVFLFVSCQVFRVLEPLYLHITEGYTGSQTHLGGGEFAGRLSGAPADVINPNELGFVIATAIPFLHFLLWHGDFKRKLIYLTLMPALLYALIQTMSRGAFIALLVVGWVIFIKSRHKLGIVLVAVLVAVAGWSTMTPVQKDRYLSLVEEDSQGAAGVEGRLGGIISEFALGLQRPIVGHGIGTTSEAKYHVYGIAQASHSLYAQLLIEIGFIGAIIFLAFLYRIGRQLAANQRLLRQHGDQIADFYRNLNQAMVAVFWMYVVYSINYYGLSQYYWYFFGGLVLAFAFVLKQQLKEQTQEREPEQPHTTRYPLARPNRFRRTAR